MRVLQLPRRLVDGSYIKQDADDFIKFQGPQAFERLLSGSENGIEFRMSQIAAKYDLKNDADRIAYAAEISQVLCTLDSAVEREVYTVRAAEMAGLTPWPHSSPRPGPSAMPIYAVPWPRRVSFA